MIRPVLLSLFFGALLGACVSDNPEALRARANAKGVQGALPCCTSISEVFVDAKQLEWTSATLGKATRHYDFGKGIAPFAVYRLPADAKIIETEAPLHLIGWAYGGDGVARYVDAKLLFFDAQLVPMATRIIDASQAFTGYGTRSLFTIFEVPDGAVFLALTTDPALNDVHGVGVIRNRPEARITSASKSFFAGGELLPRAYRLVSYGTVRIHQLPND